MVGRLRSALCSYHFALPSFMRRNSTLRPRTSECVSEFLAGSRCNEFMKRNVARWLRHQALRIDRRGIFCGRWPIPCVASFPPPLVRLVDFRRRPKAVANPTSRRPTNCLPACRRFYSAIDTGRHRLPRDERRAWLRCFRMNIRWQGFLRLNAQNAAAAK